MFKLVSEFYQNINSIFKYEENIETSLQKLINEKTDKKAFNIIPTKVRISEKECNIVNYHAVCLVLFNGIIYFFDPNGVIPNPTYFFVYDDVKGKNTKTYLLNTKTYLEKFDKSIVYIKNRGPQIFTKSVKKCNFINEGGYCMFYIYIFIKYLSNLHETQSLTETKIMKIFNYEYSNTNMFIFPTKEKIEGESKIIIDNIIAWKNP